MPNNFSQQRIRSIHRRVRVAMIPSRSLEPVPSSLLYFYFEWCFPRLHERGLSVDEFGVEDKAFGSCLGTKVSWKSVVVALV